MNTITIGDLTKFPDNCFKKKSVEDRCIGLKVERNGRSSRVRVVVACEIWNGRTEIFIICVNLLSAFPTVLEQGRRAAQDGVLQLRADSNACQEAPRPLILPSNSFLLLYAGNANRKHRVTSMLLLRCPHVGRIARSTTTDKEMSQNRATGWMDDVSSLRQLHNRNRAPLTFVH
ncbi:unnamed protein product [Litomosoides sigmodontis]|uniref:Uncharacterized protein n=1 Tax=Litomosoides sigmodontis TaxID=42156 RepID=A0A3P6TI32_LITSI|nr:unnamed protein product [Litomosoides sigmodontis]